MKEYDAYLFDADGTLIDTRELIYQAFLHMGREMDIELPDRPALEATVGLPLKTALPIILGASCPAEYYDRAGKIYGDCIMQRYPEYLRLFPGARETLAALAERGKKLALVTSRRRPSLEVFFEYLQIKQYFAAIVTPECTTKHKPNPEPALLALELLGAQPESAVFIGDAIFDVQCGQRAGLDTVLVRWGGMDPSTWDIKPGLSVDCFAELLPT